MEIEQSNPIKAKSIKKFKLGTSSNSLKLLDHSSIVWGDNMYIWGGDNRQPKVSIKKENNFHRLRLDNYTWQTIEPTGIVPPHVHSHASTLMSDFDSQMYVFGGSTQEHKSINGLWGYNLITKAWRKIQRGPSPRQSSSMVRNKCYILIYGGMNIQTPQFYNEFYLYDTRTSNWHDVIPSKEISKRMFQKMVSIRHTMVSYLFGGCSEEGQSLNDFYMIKLQGKKNCLVENIETKIQPSPRMGHGMQIVKDYIFVVGGEKQLKKKAELLDDAWVFSIQLNEWFQIDLLNKFQPRSHFSLSSYKNQLIIYGGIKKDQVDDQMVIIEIQNQNQPSVPQIKEPQYEKFIENEKISFQFLFQAANLIKFPFAAIGLLVDNAINTHANCINISINDRPAPIPQSQKKIPQKDKEFQNLKGPDEVLRYILIEDDGKPWNNEQLPQIIFNTQVNNPILSESSDRKYKSMMQKDNLKKEFGNNLKLGSFRLGRAFLYVSYYEYCVRVALLMPNFLGDETQFTSRYYCEDLKHRQFLTRNGAKVKKNIEWVCKHFLKPRALDQIGPFNQLYVFQLRHYCTLQGIFYQLNPYNNDCIFYYLKELQFLSKLGFPVFQCPDVSLRSYLSLLYLKMQTRITLQTDKKSRDQIQNQLFLDKIDQQRQKGYVKEIQYANEYPQLAECKIVELYFDHTMQQQKQDACFHSGILIYHKNRLICRYKYQLGQIFQHKFYRKRYCKGESNVFQFFGYIQLPDSINVNIVKTNVTHPILLQGFNSNIKLIIKDMKRKINSKFKPSFPPTSLQVHDQSKLDEQKLKQSKHVQRRDNRPPEEIDLESQQSQNQEEEESDSDSEYHESRNTPINGLIEDIKKDAKEKKQRND